MELKDRLKVFINCTNKNFKQFSEYCDIKNTTLCKYLKGNYAPTEEALLKLYQVGVNICWLLSGEGSMFASNKTGQELINKHEKTHPEYGVKLTLFFFCRISPAYCDVHIRMSVNRFFCVFKDSNIYSAS